MKNLFLLGFLLTSSFAFSQKNSKPFSVNGKTVTVYLTSDSGNYRLTKTGTVQFKKMGQPSERDICVFVDPKTTYQEFLGIGAALTDASAEVFAKMPEAKQAELLKSFFDSEKGIGYTLARTNIHSCDFSSGSYTYVKEGDSLLKSFTIAHDEAFRIPFIKKAIKAAGGKLTLYASPWSPPAFMKSNNDMLHGGSLKPEYAQSWANYYVKFIKAYEKVGIPIWGLTIQNEPMATQRWESCIFSAEEERDFLKNYLGPTIQKNGLGTKKIIVWDHNRDLMTHRAATIFEDPEAAKYAWGMGFHWYESWSGGQPMFQNVGAVNKAYPSKKLIFTEGCAEAFKPGIYNTWANGERYGRSMINDFNNGTVAWTDWNIFLDETGGPNHVQNFCYAPVHADTRTGEIIYTPSYYYIGHFSKFIKPGALKISSTASRSQLLTTAFKNKNGKIVVVVMNQGEEQTPYYLWINGQAAEVTAPAHSIATLTF
ncbi:MAG: glycoside hydrolase family 30 protein [Ferruginibacter sp.]